MMRPNLALQQRASTATDSSGLWFAPGEQYLRLGVAEDGWYRLSRTDLVAAGLGSETFDSTRVKLLFRGQPFPSSSPDRMSASSTA